MLNKHQVITPIPVHDVENAAVFYGEILGLKLVRQRAVGAVFESGGGILGLHLSNAAGTSQATSAWWIVDDVPATVKELKSRGVKFEKNYDLPYVKKVGDVYHMDDTRRAAWFKDIDGNILGVGNF